MVSPITRLTVQCIIHVYRTKFKQKLWILTPSGGWLAVNIKITIAEVKVLDSRSRDRGSVLF